MAIANHLLYLTISIAFTICVGRSLYKHGYPFLIECFESPTTAAAVNKLFLVGFYLVNFGFIGFVLRYGEVGSNIEETVEVLAGRIGFVALVMGVMHFNNLFWCKFAQHRRATSAAPRK